MQEEISNYKKDKNSEVEKVNEDLIKDLQAKTRNLMEKQKEYEDETKNYLEKFKNIKEQVENLIKSLNFDEEKEEAEKVLSVEGVSENNIMWVFAQIEKKLKNDEKILWPLLIWISIR